MKAASNDSHGLTITRVWNADHTDEGAHMLPKKKRRDHNATPSALTFTRFLQHSQTSAASLKNIVVKKTKHGC